MNTLPTFAWIATLLVLAGCATESPPAVYTLQINSIDVRLEAVDRAEVVLQAASPGGAPDLDRGFAPTPDGSYENGGIRTHVTNAGEFQITLASSWIAANHTSAASVEFAMRIPIFTEQLDASGVNDLYATVAFERDRVDGGDSLEETIAVGHRLLDWPLAGSQRIASVHVRNTRTYATSASSVTIRTPRHDRSGLTPGAPRDCTRAHGGGGASAAQPSPADSQDERWPVRPPYAYE